MMSIPVRQHIYVIGHFSDLNFSETFWKVIETFLVHKVIENKDREATRCDRQNKELASLHVKESHFYHYTYPLLSQEYSKYNSHYGRRRFIARSARIHGANAK